MIRLAHKRFFNFDSDTHTRLIYQEVASRPLVFRCNDDEDYIWLTRKWKTWKALLVPKQEAVQRKKKSEMRTQFFGYFQFVKSQETVDRKWQQLEKLQHFLFARSQNGKMNYSQINTTQPTRRENAVNGKSHSSRFCNWNVRTNERTRSRKKKIK